MVKAPYGEKVELKRGKWTVEEDELLVKYIQANGEGSWRCLPKNAGLLRCGKSCRLRWTNYLRPNLKRGKFTAEEDETIVKLHSSLGNRWSLIAQHLSGRTDNEIKNYWNSHLRRRIYNFRNLKELIKAPKNVPKVMAGGGDCDESSRKQDMATRSNEGSIKSHLLKNHTVDIGSIRKSNSSCPGGKYDVTWSERGSIEFFLPKNHTVDIGSIQKSNSSCPRGKDDVTWSEGGSIESFLPKNHTVDIGSIRKSNSSCPGGKDDATRSEGGSIESFLLENIEINSSCPGGMDNATWFEENSIESLLLENYIVDIGSNRETNSSCFRGRYDATWFEEGSSIESLLTKNYIVDLEFLTQLLPHEIKGLAMQQHDGETKIHESRNEEEEEEDKDNKDIHGTPKKQVCEGIWSFDEQGQQVQGPHEQNEGNEVVLQQQHNECLHDFDNNWFDINFDYFLEELRT